MPHSPRRARGWGAGPALAGILVLVLVGSMAFLMLRGGSKGGRNGKPEQTQKPTDVIAAAIAIADPSHYAELDGLPPLTEEMLAHARQFNEHRDYLKRFRKFMEARYNAKSKAEEETGGIIDLEKAALTRKMHDDLVEWRYLRNVRQAVQGGSPKTAVQHARHPGVAVKHRCDDHNAAKNDPQLGFRLWAHPQDENVPLPTTEDGGALISARELVRRRIRVWKPVPDSAQFLDRQTVVCATIVSKPSRIEHAFMQYSLWGRYCDDFIVFVPQLPADVTVGTDFDEGFTAEFVKELSNKYGLAPKKIMNVEIQSVVSPAELDAEDKAKGVKPSDDGDVMSEMRQTQIRRASWEIFKETVKQLETWPRFHFMQNIFFTNEDVYAIPENIYALVSDVTFKMMYDVGTPVMLGNRMAVPDSGVAGTKVPAKPVQGGDVSSIPSEGATPYLNPDAFLMSNSAVRLFKSRLTSPECFPHDHIASPEIALSRCMSAVGVYPRDTSDVNGHDVFPALSLNWLARLAVDPEASYWYSTYRPRPVPRGFAVLSEFTAAVPHVKTVEDMATLHMWIWEEHGPLAAAPTLLHKVTQARK